MLVAAAGWHYLFHSHAARDLENLEQRQANALRCRLRKLCGACMMLLGGTVFALLRMINLDRPTPVAMILLLAILLLLGTISALALIDLRLTWRLRRRQ